MAFTRSYGKSAIKALKKLHAKKPVDIINAHLPLVSWKRKEFRWLEQNIAPVVSCLHGSWLGEKEGVKRAAAAKESATWKNPNDLAILTTAGWYSKYERAGILESSICVANSQSTLKEFQRWYKPDEISIAKLFYGAVTTKCSGHPISMMRLSSWSMKE